MTGKRPIELLSPAKNTNIGIEAINHGADAVYIGAPRFGARSAAGNDKKEIERLIKYAHLYRARVYIALNTLLKEEELSAARDIINDMYQMGADAIIVQDMGILKLDIPPIALHASTQTDNRSVEKVRFLESSGFSQIVLARELSLPQIREIANSTDVPLEVFIHGALCVSYSGQCYMSHALSGRSANRGECAQYCRLPYTLKDADGRVWVEDKHLLSMKDLNQSDRLEALLDAGVTSLKIEGRLKEMSYVKNITAYYRRELDRIFDRRGEFTRSSSGNTTFSFVPNPQKSFNRDFTHYFLDGRKENISSLDTPKSLGEYVGNVKSISGNSITVAGIASLNNGDGLCFLNEKSIFEGFRVNKVIDNQIFPAEMPEIGLKTRLYRNLDYAFEKQLEKPTADRRIQVDIKLYDTSWGYALQLVDEDGIEAVVTAKCAKEKSRTPQQENQLVQLSKLGNTIFKSRKIEIDFSDNWFIPSSALSEIRRKAVEKLLISRSIAYRTEKRRLTDSVALYPEKSLTYLGNVGNSLSRKFYEEHGVSQIAPAFELSPTTDVPLMFTKHCVKYMMGWCKKYNNKSNAPQEPLSLVYRNTELILKFDCSRCEMMIYKK